jgi:hypothetical protein
MPSGDIRDATDRGNAHLLNRAAQAFRLEMMGKDRELIRRGGVFSSLAKEMETLSTALGDYSLRHNL